MTARDARFIGWFVLALVVSVGLSYLFALAGEPQSVWVWRDVLGILR